MSDASYVESGSLPIGKARGRENAVKTMTATVTGVGRASSKDPWHAVAVVVGAVQCPSVAKVLGKRFLAQEAPRLPLAGCSLAHRCQCVYRHFVDRRGGPRRAADRGMFGLRVGLERRGERGRPAGDAAQV